MEFVVKTRSKKTAHFINSIMPNMIKQLGLANSRKFLLIEICKLKHDKGLTTPLPGLDTYVIALSPAKWQDLGVTLAHEMVHVRQLAKGMLRVEGGNKWWMGKKYSKRTKYLDMPWELDAFSRQEILFRRALEKC
jgi:hypothetical protein